MTYIGFSTARLINAGEALMSTQKISLNDRYDLEKSP
ncbi:MAG: hypothetical protein ACI9KK_001316, partial [Ascidiaceihabitans sp.]